MPTTPAPAGLLDLRALLALVAAGQAPPPVEALVAAVEGRLRAAPGGQLVEVHVDRGAPVVPWLAHEDGPSLGRAMESAWWHRGDRAPAPDVDLEARLGPAAALLPRCRYARAALLTDAEGWHEEIRRRRRRAWATELAAPLAPFAALAGAGTDEGRLAAHQALGGASAAYGAVLTALYPGLPEAAVARAGAALAGAVVGSRGTPEGLRSLDALVISSDEVTDARRHATLVGLLAEARPKVARR